MRPERPQRKPLPAPPDPADDAYTINGGSQNVSAGGGAASVVGVAALANPGFLVEIEVVAAKDSK